LDGIAVTQGPGLVGSLLVGTSLAKALAWVHGLPLVGVNHLEGHIYASFLTDDPPEYPFLALVVSGGHTALYQARAPPGWPRPGRRRSGPGGFGCSSDGPCARARRGASSAWCSPAASPPTRGCARRWPRKPASKACGCTCHRPACAPTTRR